MVTMVLLNVDWMWAMPLDTFRRAFFFFALAMIAVLGFGREAEEAAPSRSRLAGRYLLSFFLFATVFRGPFRVRAFVFDRCPRTGNFFRWRSPR